MAGMLQGQERVSVAKRAESGEEITCSHRHTSLFINSALPQPPTSCQALSIRLPPARPSTRGPRRPWPT